MRNGHKWCAWAGEEKTSIKCVELWPQCFSVLEDLESGHPLPKSRSGNWAKYGKWDAQKSMLSLHVPEDNSKLIFNLTFGMPAAEVAFSNLGRYQVETIASRLEAIATRQEAIAKF